MTKGMTRPIWTVAMAALAAASVRAADVRPDLGREQVGKPPASFEPMVGTWLVVQDGPDKVVEVDSASCTAPPTRS
jgi:hypothetical protein